MAETYRWLSSRGPNLSRWRAGDVPGGLPWIGGKRLPRESEQRALRRAPVGRCQGSGGGYLLPLHLHVDVLEDVSWGDTLRPVGAFDQVIPGIAYLLPAGSVEDGGRLAQPASANQETGAVRFPFRLIHFAPAIR